MGADGLIDEPRVILVDQEHAGLRVLVPLLTFFTCIGTYWFGMQIISNAGSGSTSLTLLIVLPASVIAALAVAWLGERVVKRLWPSRRHLQVETSGLTLRNRGETEAALNWDQRVNVVSWRFVVPPRRGRVPKGWYCMACRLTQDDAAITLYSFFPPDEAKELAFFDQFAVLASRKMWEKATPAERLAMGEQARLHSAEAERWQYGAELTRQDFADLMHVLGARVEGWARGAHDPHPASPVEPDDAPERPPSKGDGKPVQL